jgi:adenine-specific DNA-methyltransferase
MDGQSLDITAEKLAQLRAIFPEVFSEDKVDFARLKDVLGESVNFPNEHYELSWAGKAEARREIQNQTTATLIPDKENSVNFEATGNIFVEGENLEVLRILQKSYFGKVKMIYIDPPYNTGNDSFVYPDDYAERQDEYNKRTGKTNGEGYLNKQDLWRKNTRENGQFHSVWLSMMYPRIYLARNLLREDGVVFVSINDNESANFKLLMDEVMGEGNFVACFVWQSKKGGGSDAGTVVEDHEYVLAYAKDENASGLSKITVGAEELDRTDEKGSYRRGRELNKWGANSRREDRPTMWFPIPGPDGVDVFPTRNDGKEGCWRWGKKKMSAIVQSGNVEFVKRDDGTYIVYEKIRSTDPRFKPYRTFLADTKTTADGSKEVKSLFADKKIFDFAKPKDLLKTLIEVGAPNDDDTILDFFAGSGTTAQAVLESNEENGGNRRFICVQMPEYLEEDSEAFKAGYRTIADICKARIQKVIAKLQTVRAAELALNGNQQSLGFQAFRLAPSNFKQWRGDVTGEDILKQLELHIHSEKETSEAEKMLYELLLKAGFLLTAKVELAEIDRQAVYTVEDGKMLVFFDDYTPAINAYVHQQKPQRVVCLDRVFKGNDEALTNFKLQLKEAGIDLTII